MLDVDRLAPHLPLPALREHVVSSRAHARRRLAAWERYERRWPQVTIRPGVGAYRWWVRAIQHRRGRRKAGAS